MSTVRPNFTMNITWEGLIRLSLSKKRQKIQFPDTRCAGYLWLSQCTVAPTALWKCVSLGHPLVQKHSKRKRKEKSWDAKSEQYCAWCFAEETFTLHGLERIQRIRPQCDISSCTPEWCWLIVFTVLYNFQHPGCFISIFKDCSSFFSRFEFPSAIRDCPFAFDSILLMSICF